MDLVGNSGLTSFLGLSSGSSSGGQSGGTSDSGGGGSSSSSGEDRGILGSAVDWVVGENGGEMWGDIWDCVTGEQEWAGGPTGGFMPQSLADEMNNVRDMVPDNAHENGMHAWHAGSNAMLAEKLGILGAPLILAGGLFHETPLDWESWKAEEEWQGTVNHQIDSAMDIVSNVVGMGIGYFGGDDAVQTAIDVGNHIPGPGDPDPAFGGAGGYQGNPSDAW